MHLRSRVRAGHSRRRRGLGGPRYRSARGRAAAVNRAPQGETRGSPALAGRVRSGQSEVRPDGGSPLLEPRRRKTVACARPPSSKGAKSPGRGDGTPAAGPGACPKAAPRPAYSSHRSDGTALRRRCRRPAEVDRRPRTAPAFSRKRHRIRSGTARPLVPGARRPRGGSRAFAARRGALQHLEV